MIEIVETYDCRENSCGRKFSQYEDLLEHYKRRHLNLYNKAKLKEKINIEEITETINFLENEANQAFEIDSERLEIIEQTMADFKEKDSDSLNDTMFKTTVSTCITNTESRRVNTITEEMIDFGVKYFEYSEIEDVDLEDRNLIVFRNKKNINFANLISISSLNLSKNYIKDITDIKALSSIRHLNISQNNIDDISCLEFLENLEILKAENNEIRSISALTKCRNLNILEIANNKISYEQSTYNTIQFLKNLKELTVKANTFLEEKIGFKHIFIYKYQKLDKLDGEEITDLDREIALRFIKGNSPNDSDDLIDDPPTKAVIEKIDYKPSETKLKLLKTSNSLKTNNSNKEYNYLQQIEAYRKEAEGLRIENEKLIKLNKTYELELKSNKIELDDTRQLNKEYEKIIDDYRRKFDPKDSIKLKQEVEQWKREYFELSNKNISHDFSKTDGFFNDINKRPQTAINRNNFNIEEFIRSKKEKNSLDDSLNKSEEEIIVQDFAEDDTDPEIEELLKKSVTNLKSLKSQIKILNKATDVHPKQENRSRSIHKEKLKPVVYKKK